MGEVLKFPFYPTTDSTKMSYVFKTNDILVEFFNFLGPNPSSYSLKRVESAFWLLRRKSSSQNGVLCSKALAVLFSQKFVEIRLDALLLT